MTHQAFYTSKGRQRYVAAKADTVRFALTGAPEGSYVEYSEEPVPADTASLAEQAAFGQTFTRLNCIEGAISHATALCVVLIGAPLTAARLEIIPTNEPDWGCVGEMTRNNALLASATRNLRGSIIELRHGA